VAAEEGDAKIHLLLRAVNQYPDADYCAALLGRRRYNLADGTAGGEDIVHDEDSLAGVNAKSPPESSFFFSFLFGKYASYS
jgi:hypothetical protein